MRDKAKITVWSHDGIIVKTIYRIPKLDGEKRMAVRYQGADVCADGWNIILSVAGLPLSRAEREACLRGDDEVKESKVAETVEKLRNIPMDAKRIKNFMFAHYSEHLDDSNCLNTTALAEDTATNYGDNREDEDIPEEYFELAFEVEQQLLRDGHVNA